MQCNVFLVPAAFELGHGFAGLSNHLFFEFFYSLNSFTRLLLDDIMFEVVHGLDKFIKQPFNFAFKGRYVGYMLVT